ncbi:MAG: hypothetical protein J1F38_05130 [Muribaculaceae bacterium]|nr:hypothetical protein [Muribaculaceae bacterium]
MSKKLAEKLISVNSMNRIESISGSLLFFPPNYISNHFSDFFKLKEKRKFDEAFAIVTSGKGNEISKINSLLSSSLLSLLVFYKLYNNTNKDLYVKFSGLEELKFNRCLFEVRNKVIRRPSCVDVLLISEDNKTLLFLESKFSEYYDCKFEKEYGKGYIELYDELKDLLFPIKFNRDIKDKAQLYSESSCYIEGIKQAISHLIGLVKGPTDENLVTSKNDIYVKTEYQEYKQLSKEASEIYFGTILYDPSVLEEDNLFLCNYIKLYEEIIGKNGSQILDVIKQKYKVKNGQQKDIKILRKPLLYTDIDKEYLNKLDKIKDFYGL